MRSIGKKGLLVAGVLLMGLLVSGCASMFEAISDSADAIGRSRGEAGGAMADATGLAAFQDGMVASLVYAQVFFAGGYAEGYKNFKEGEGVLWEITARDDNETQRMEVERALLRRTSEGNSWWFLRYTDEEEEEFISEALLDEEYNIVVFRYRDPESGEIREWIPEEDEEADTDTESEEVSAVDADEDDYYRSDFKEHVVGKGPLTVPAGRFNAQHVLIEDVYVEDEGEDTEESYRVSYEWWLVPQVPGELVKYVWTDESDNSTLSGELISYGKGYETQLGSF